MNSNFCIVPFIHLSTAPQGTVRPCCFSSSNKIKKDNGDLFNIGNDSIEDIWNSNHFKNLRKRILANEIDEHCTFCFQEEAVNKQSKRMRENKYYKDSIINLVNQAKNNENSLNSLPQTIDLRLGNLCNLKCISCNPSFSSKVQKEMITEWPNDFFLKKDYQSIKINNDWFKSDIFRENLIKIIPNLKFIYVSGGEPVINPALIDFLKRSIHLGYSKNQKLRFNTNLVILDQNFFELLKEFKNVEISVSLDAIGSELNIIRYPASFSSIETNMHKILSLKDNTRVTINCTTSILNIFSLKDLYSWIDKISKHYNTELHTSIDLVHEPVFLSLKYLSPRLKKEALREIEYILENYKLTNPEKNDLASLNAIITEQPTDYKDKKKELIEYIELLEKIRGHSIFNTLKGVTYE